MINFKTDRDESNRLNGAGKTGQESEVECHSSNAGGIESCLKDTDHSMLRKKPTIQEILRKQHE